MGLTEHTGHGVPTIIKKYGKEVFEIRDNYIMCRIPFNKKVLGMTNKSVSTSNFTNASINKTEKSVLGILIENPKKKTTQMASEIGVTIRTIERTLVSLKKKGLIERTGSSKNGSWLVVQ